MEDNTREENSFFNHEEEVEQYEQVPEEQTVIHTGGSHMPGFRNNINPTNDNLARGINRKKDDKTNKEENAKNNLNTRENNRNQSMNPLPGGNLFKDKNKDSNNSSNGNNQNDTNNKGGLSKKDNNGLDKKKSLFDKGKVENGSKKGVKSLSGGFGKIASEGFKKIWIAIPLPFKIIIPVVLLLLILFILLFSGIAAASINGSDCSHEVTEKDLLNFINTFEGNGGYCDEAKTKYEAYLVSGDRVTIGHGVTSDYIKNLQVGDCISVEEVDSYQLKAIDVKRNFIRGIFSDVGLTNYQEDALTSMAYNGCADFFDDMKTAYQEDGYEGLWREMKGCNNGILGLKRRRKAEFDLFVTGDYIVATFYKSKEFDDTTYNDYNSENVLSRKDSVRTSCTSFNGKFLYPSEKECPMLGPDSCFGYRVHPIYGVVRHHDGVDLSCQMGVNVLASADGEVIDVSKAYVSSVGYGAYVLIQHDDNLKTRYAHLSYVNVDKGDIVKAGDVIGKVGSSGGSTGPHIHYEVIENDTFVDPAQFIDLKGFCD